jgi:hypothetical protein
VRGAQGLLQAVREERAVTGTGAPRPANTAVIQATVAAIRAPYHLRITLMSRSAVAPIGSNQVNPLAQR